VAEAIAQLLADDALRERLGAQALAHVRTRWTWPHGAEVLEGHFRALLEGRADASNGGC
jgi:glycosyltransferase involved in cell wall biosynthesis